MPSLYRSIISRTTGCIGITTFVFVFCCLKVINLLSRSCWTIFSRSLKREAVQAKRRNKSRTRLSVVGQVCQLPFSSTGLNSTPNFLDCSRSNFSIVFGDSSNAAFLIHSNSCSLRYTLSISSVSTLKYLYCRDVLIPSFVA